MNPTIAQAFLVALVAAPSLVLAQGPLLPPSTGDDEVGPNPPLVGGNPSPTMKTLHQVEPRTPVGADTTPGDGSNEFIITTSGSYYLTQNIVVAGTDAIAITAADVTLDLNGFSISGFGSTSGILIGEDADRCTIRNGHLFNFTFGVNRELNSETADEAAGGRFENLTVSGHGSIGLLGGNGWTVRNCRIQGGGNSGIVVGEGSVVTHSTVRDMNAVSGTAGIQGREGSVISHCAVSNCDVSYGIRGGAGSVIEGCSVHDTTATFTMLASYGILGESGATISSSSVSECAVVYGIYGSTGSTIEQCTARNNNSTYTDDSLSAGIYAGSRSLVRGSTATGTRHTNSAQLFGSGISAEFSCLVVNCMANENDGAGIVVGQNSEVRNCKSHLNGQNGPGAGILCDDYSADSPTFGWNKIVGNDCTFNLVGIDVDTEANLIIQNSFRGNTTNFNIIANNNVGPVILPGDSGAINGFGAGGGGVNTTNPWANFSW